MAVTSDIVIPLIAGLFGGAGGAYLTARHSARHDEKTRMLDAADDVSTTATRSLQVLLSVGRRASTLEETGERFNPADGSQTAALVAELKRGNAAADEVHAKLARVILLFGDASWPARFSRELVLSLRAYLSVLEDWPDFDEQAENDRFEEAHVAHQEFNRASYNEISASTLRRWIRRRRFERWSSTPRVDRAEAVEKAARVKTDRPNRLVP